MNASTKTPSDDDANGLKPVPTSRRCPTIDAAAILAIAEGRLSLSRPIEPLNLSVQSPAVTLPIAEKRIEGYQPRQPEKHRFDATDIYMLSRAMHPWQAAPIEKADAADTSEAEAGTDKAAIAKAG